LLVLFSLAFAAPVAKDIADTSAKIGEIMPFDATGSTGDIVQYSWAWGDGDHSVSNYWRPIGPPDFSTSVDGLVMGCSGQLYASGSSDSDLDISYQVGGFETFDHVAKAGQASGVAPAQMKDTRWLMAGTLEPKVYAFNCLDPTHTSVALDWYPSSGNTITALDWVRSLETDPVHQSMMVAATTDGSQAFITRKSLVATAPDTYILGISPVDTTVTGMSVVNDMANYQTSGSTSSKLFAGGRTSGMVAKLACFDGAGLGQAFVQYDITKSDDLLTPGSFDGSSEVTAVYATQSTPLITELIVATAKPGGAPAALYHALVSSSVLDSCGLVGGVVDGWTSYTTPITLQRINAITKTADGKLWLAGEGAGTAMVFYSATSDPASAVWYGTGVISATSAKSILYNNVDTKMYVGTVMPALVFKQEITPLSGHAWDDLGEYSASMTVTDGTDASDTDDFKVTVAGKLAQPGIVVKPGVIVRFDGSHSTTDGDPLTSYAWDFDDGATGTGVSIEHKFTEKGKYTVKLTASDGTNSAYSYFVVLVGTPPVAKMTVNPSPSESGDKVEFDAGSSYDTDGTIEGYEWAVPAPPLGCAYASVACDSPSDSKQCYTFTTPAKTDCKYQVMLTVTDNDGLTDDMGVYQTVLPTSLVNKVWDLAIDGQAQWSVYAGELLTLKFTVTNKGSIEAPDFKVCTDVGAEGKTKVYTIVQTADGEKKVPKSLCSDQMGSLAPGASAVVELEGWSPEAADCTTDWVNGDCKETLDVSIDYNNQFVFTTPGAVKTEGLEADKNNRVGGKATSGNVEITVLPARQMGKAVLTPEFPLEAIAVVLVLVPLIAMRRLTTPFSLRKKK
jgi:hypothetical protein